MLWVKKEITHLTLICRNFSGNWDISEGPKKKKKPMLLVIEDAAMKSLQSNP